MSTPRLEVEHVRKSFGGLEALRDVSVAVQAGEFLTLLGPSGCGKTTLMRTITGYLRPDGGSIRMDGRDITDVPTHQRNMGMVFQSFALFPHLTVAGNLAFPLSLRGVSRSEQQLRVAEALRMVRLESLADAYPRQLSGGQQQRVGLARALIYQPSVLLLDEPLSNLDLRMREELRLEISEITRRLGITSVYVTHDQEEAFALSDRVAVMSQGQIVQTGTPREIYEHPRTRFVAAFIGMSNFLPVVVSGGVATVEGVAGTIDASHLGEPSGPCTLFIRPLDITLVAGEDPGVNRLVCRVVDAVFMGERMDYVLELGAGLRLKGQADPGVVFARDSRVTAVIPPGKVTRITD